MKASATANLQRAALDGLPEIRFPDNLRLAVGAGRRLGSILREVVALRRGLGKLTPQEYFYYRLWDPDLPVRGEAAFRRQAGTAPDAPRLQRPGLVRGRR